MPCNVSTCSLNTADQKASFTPTFLLRRHDAAVSTKAVGEKCGSMKWCHSNDDDTVYAVQRLNMLFEHRRPKRLLLHLRICFADTMPRYLRKLLVKSAERSTKSVMSKSLENSPKRPSASAAYVPTIKHHVGVHRAAGVSGVHVFGVLFLFFSFIRHQVHRPTT